jgi:beta-glucanase (GH16 family)/sugar lactone lactonase YvrE
MKKKGFCSRFGLWCPGLMVLVFVLFSACSQLPDQELSKKNGQSLVPNTINYQALSDSLDSFDSFNWKKSTDIYNGSPFGCAWLDTHVSLSGGLMTLLLNNEASKGRSYSGGEYKSQHFYTSGRFETRMKAARGTGVCSSFFTCTGAWDGTQWDEIDAEIEGEDTTKLHCNWYAQGNNKHHLNNASAWVEWATNIDLRAVLNNSTFDAANDFHVYAIEWKAGDWIKWYVDGTLVYTAIRSTTVNPDGSIDDILIPWMPQRILANIWCGDNSPGSSWLGTFNSSILPVQAQYDYISYTPISPPVIQDATNGLLHNGDFSQGTNYWWNGSYNGATSSSAIENGVFHMIPTRLVNTWDIQLDQPGIYMKALHQYQLRYDVKASANRSLTVQVAKNNGPWTAYWATTANLTTSWQTITANFTFWGTADDADASLQFQCGNSLVDYYIDNVQLIDLGPAVMQEQIVNGDFSNPGQLNYWSLQYNVGGYRGSASWQVDGIDKNAHITILSTGYQDYAIMFSQGTPSFAPGLGYYILKFDAKSSVAQTMPVQIWSGSGFAFTRYNAALTTSMQTFYAYFPFQNSLSYNQYGTLQFLMGYCSGDIYIDNVSFRTVVPGVYSGNVSAPTALTATADAALSQVTLNWANADNSVAGFNIYYSNVNTKPSTPQLAVGPYTKNSLVKGLIPNTTYYFWVESYAGASISTSVTAQATTPYPTVSTFAGNYSTAGEVDGSGTSARFYNPGGMAVDSSGNIYVSDYWGHTVRKVTPSGQVTTFAGNAAQPGYADGVGTAARFYYPSGIAIDSAGYIYVSDENGHIVRKINPTTRAVTTFAYVRGTAPYTGPIMWNETMCNLTIDTSGNLYMLQSDKNAVYKITSSGVVSLFAGSGGPAGSWADGTGTAARFNFPTGIVYEPSGYLYVSDGGNRVIRKINLSTSQVTTFAGYPNSYGYADGTGGAARFAFPYGICVDSAGYIYVNDMHNQVVRVISKNAEVKTIAGIPGQIGYQDGLGSTAKFNYPKCLATDSAGTLYLNEYNQNSIRKIKF